MRKLLFMVAMVTAVVYTLIVPLPVFAVAVDVTTEGSYDFTKSKNIIQDRAIPYLQKNANSVTKRLVGNTQSSPQTVSIILDSEYTHIAETSNGSIRVNPRYVENNESDIKGVIVHEYVHIVQDAKTYNNESSWFVEGVADWVRDYYLKERTPAKISNSSKKTDSYKTAAAFIEWLENKNPGTITQLTVYMQTNKYSEEMFTQRFDKTSDELWVEFKREQVGVAAVQSPDSELYSEDGSSVGAAVDGNEINENDTLTIIIFFLILLSPPAVVFYGFYRLFKKNTKKHQSSHSIDSISAQAHSIEHTHDASESPGQYPKLFK